MLISIMPTIMEEVMSAISPQLRREKMGEPKPSALHLVTSPDYRTVPNISDHGNHREHRPILITGQVDVIDLTFTS
jgi:hypothetical protein